MSQDRLKVHYVLSGESVKATAMIGRTDQKPVVTNGEDGIDAVCNAVDKLTGSQVHRNSRRFEGVRVKTEGLLYEATFGIRNGAKTWNGTAVGIDLYEAIANAYYAAKTSSKSK